MPPNIKYRKVNKEEFWYKKRGINCEARYERWIPQIIKHCKLRHVEVQLFIAPP